MSCILPSTPGPILLSLILLAGVGGYIVTRALAEMNPKYMDSLRDWLLNRKGIFVVLLFLATASLVILAIGSVLC